ncbi:MAG: hypothetical protein EBR81_08725, partial [Proteobacteria bacterium]|nr:hypothetical protein [Pseudomonadota bacterium]
MIEVNEKVLINKKVFLFYKETPSLALKMKLKFDLERRVEEVMITQFSSMSEEDFRKIKQPLNIDFRNVNDPYGQSSNEIGWVGFTLGYLMMFFIAFFGTNITRSINREKSSRISEVLLASVRPHQLMMGKITGNWMASLLQLGIWIALVGFTGSQLKELGLEANAPQNDQVLLFYQRINYLWLLPNFILFFLGTYWVFASFFTVMGAMSGDHSDGQQFAIPIWILLSLSIFAGYNAMAFPESDLTVFFTYFPWTSGMVAMIKLAVGVSPLEYLFLLFAWIIQVCVGTVLVILAGRIFKQGILSLYISGEESASQVRLRAERLNAIDKNLW